MLQLDGVVAGYGRGDILRGVDLVVEQGTVMCLVGPNGAGKSMVLKTLSGLLRPREGRILYEGEDVCRTAPAQRLARGIVHVAQERTLFPLMTIWDNLLMSGHVSPTVRSYAAGPKRSPSGSRSSPSAATNAPASSPAAGRSSSRSPAR